MDRSKRIKTFEYFGVNYTGDNNNGQLIADCIFCGKEGHFYTERQLALFDCKRCLIKGSYFDFLLLVYERFLKPNDSLDKLTKLAEHRNLPVRAFYNYGIVYYNDRYWLPIQEHKGRLTDIRYYTLGDKTRSVDGAETGIFNLEALLDEHRKNDTIYLCEGEFDAVALNHLLSDIGIPGFAVGICGAGNFKRDFVDYFKQRHVVICFDNDSGGLAGAIKVRQALQGCTKSIKQVWWPLETPHKYDINNYVSQYAVATGEYLAAWEALNRLIRDEEFDAEHQDYLYREVDKLPDLQLSDVISEYRKILEVNKEYEQAIKVCIAIILANKFPDKRNPPWVLLIGPPGCGGTELLSSFRQTDLCHFQSTLGPHSLVSGFKTPSGVDPSVLRQVDGKCFILKDFTEVLHKSFNDRDEIFSILRGAFDGIVDRTFGNLVVRKFETWFTMLSKCTHDINNFPQAAAGERFVRFNFSSSEKEIRKQQEKALTEAISGREDKEVVQLFVKKFISQKWDYSGERLEYLANEKVRGRISTLARIVAILRTPVIRFERGRKQDIPVYEPEAETGNRVAVQLLKTALSLTIINGKEETDEDVFDIIKKMAMDTIAGYVTRITYILFKAQKYLTQDEIRERLGLAGAVQIRPILDDMVLLDILQSGMTQTTHQRNKPHYTCSKIIYELFAKAEYGF